jgi:hypothetical protein
MTVKKRIKTLLQTWKEYRKNPMQHFNTIYTVRSMLCRHVVVIGVT